VSNILAYPNEDFFKVNGERDDECSLTARSQFLLVRHAESTANKLNRDLIINN
jgi:hypothetical protein